MPQIGTAWFDIEGNFKPLDKDIDRAENRVRSRFKAIGKAGGLALGAGLAGAAVATKSFLEAQIESEKSSARMRAQLKASGKSYDQYAKRIDAAIGAQSQLSGFDDEDLQDSFTNIVRTTGDVEQSLKLVGLASDFARAKNIDVAKAGELVAKVAGGNTGILKRYGIQVGENATAQEALAALQERFAGQAQAYGNTTAGAVDRANVAWENIKETLGAAVAPAFERVVDVAGDIVGEIDKIAQRDDLDLADKFRLSREVLKKRLGPIAEEAKEALAAAAPGIQQEAGTLARKAAGAFVRAWWASDWWVKLIAGLYIARKLGVFHSYGKVGGGKFGRSFAKAATPLIIGSVMAAIFDKQLQAAAKGLADLITGKPPKGFETREKADETLRRQGREAGRGLRQDQLTAPAIVLGTGEEIPISDPRHPRHAEWKRRGKPARRPAAARPRGYSAAPSNLADVLRSAPAMTSGFTAATTIDVGGITVQAIQSERGIDPVATGVQISRLLENRFGGSPRQ